MFMPFFRKAALLFRAHDGLYAVAYFVLFWCCNILLYALCNGVLNYVLEWPDAMNFMSLGTSTLPFIIAYYLLGTPKYFLPTVLTVHFAIMLFLGGLWLTTGTFFCEPVLYLIYDTSLPEIKDFFKEFIRFRHIFLLLLSVSTFVVGLYGIQKLQSRKKPAYRHGLFIALSLTILFTILTRPWLDFPFGRFITFYKRYPLVQIHRSLTSFSRRCAMFIREIRHRKPLTNVSLDSTVSEAKGICGVFVIGESAIRSHHSIYGYPRLTTPNLQRHADDIIAFDDCITVQPTTIIALKYLLTDMTLENRHLSWTMLDVLKVAGYHIDIISNQNRSGWADSPVNMIYASADSLHFMHDKPFDAECYDGAMLPYAEEWIKENNSKEKRLLIVHLMGSHINWKERVPSDFNTGLETEGYPSSVNDYDATICYTDYVLGRLMDRLSSLVTPAYMIYISDHGTVCDYGKERRHPLTRKNSAYEVPFLVWTNSAFCHSRPELKERLKAAQHKSLQMDRLHYGLLEIMGVDFKGSLDSENFLLPEFRQLPRTMNQGVLPYLKFNQKVIQ